MADFKISGLEGLTEDLLAASEIDDETAEDILNAEADVVVASQKRTAEEFGVKDTGKLIKSIKKTKVRHNKKGGGHSISVYPHGSRKRGGKRIRNSEIGFYNEFGTRREKYRIPARPFTHVGNARCENEMYAAAENKMDEFLKKFGL